MTAVGLPCKPMAPRPDDDENQLATAETKSSDIKPTRVANDAIRVGQRVQFLEIAVLIWTEKRQIPAALQIGIYFEAAENLLEVFRSRKCRKITYNQLYLFNRENFKISCTYEHLITEVNVDKANSGPSKV